MLIKRTPRQRPAVARLRVRSGALRRTRRPCLVVVSLQKAGLDLDSQSLTPLWPQLFCLLRAGADLRDIDVFANDILRFGGAVGQDVLRMLQEYVR